MSQVKSVNAYIKKLIFNSKIILCELMSKIHRLLDEQDRKNQYEYWKLTIPSVKNLDQTNFLFTKVNKCCQDFLTPVILKMQCSEINQSLYYIANLSETDITNDEIFRDNNAESLQITIKQLLKIVNYDNVKEIWDVKVGNSQTTKYHVVLLKNGSYVYS
jgi:hypothetical protein